MTWRELPKWRQGQGMSSSTAIVNPPLHSPAAGLLPLVWRACVSTRVLDREGEHPPLRGQSAPVLASHLPSSPSIATCEPPCSRPAARGPSRTVPSLASAHSCCSTLDQMEVPGTSTVRQGHIALQLLSP